MLKSHRQLVEQQIFLQRAYRELQEVEQSLCREGRFGTVREHQICKLHARVASLDEILNRAEICQFQRLVDFLWAERGSYRNILAGLLKQTEETSPGKLEAGIPEDIDAISTVPSLVSPEEIYSILNPSPRERFHEFLHALWESIKLSFSFTMYYPEDEELFIQSIQEEFREADKQISTKAMHLSDEERKRLTLQAKILVCEQCMEAGHVKRLPNVLRYAWREKLRYESELHHLGP